MARSPRGSVVALVAVAAAVLGSTVASPAAAEPQYNAALVGGFCGEGYWQSTCLYGGVRGDVMLGRSRSSDLGFGPYVDVTTAGFDDVRFGGGAGLQLPLFDAVPFVFNAGGYARKSEVGWEPGVEGWWFIGSRSYNFHSRYIIATGLLLGLQHGLGDSRENAIVVALQLDGLLTAMPFILGYQALQPTPDDEEY